jgi:hypothetical protein
METCSSHCYRDREIDPCWGARVSCIEHNMLVMVVMSIIDALILLCAQVK